jgi:ABC-type multidrug transport system ATPase subunit
MDTTSDVAIATRRLTKRYGDILAVDGLDLAVHRGEVYGFLGRNGAGKTTTIRLLLGLVRPTAGESWILGRLIRPGETTVFADVGYLVEVASAYPNLTVRENLEVQRRMTRSPRSAVDGAIALLGLSRSADRLAGELSLGNKQRLSLARAMLHSPRVLVLDEPANALDPAGIVEIRELLRKLATERGVTVFMSSHILAEVAHLADRIAIVHEGRLLEELDRQALAAKAAPYVEVRVSDSERAAAVLGGAGYTGIVVEPDDRGRLRLPHLTEERTPEVARLLVGAGVDLIALTPLHEDLETHFLRVTGGAS